MGKNQYTLGSPQGVLYLFNSSHINDLAIFFIFSVIFIASIIKKKDIYLFSLNLNCIIRGYIFIYISYLGFLGVIAIILCEAASIVYSRFRNAL